MSFLLFLLFLLVSLAAVAGAAVASLLFFSFLFASIREPVVLCMFVLSFSYSSPLSSLVSVACFFSFLLLQVLQLVSLPLSFIFKFRADVLLISSSRLTDTSVFVVVNIPALDFALFFFSFPLLQVLRLVSRRPLFHLRFLRKSKYCLGSK